uniref:Mitochondrial oxaloacetate transport protein n=1 Tax=Peronospora matthiolae TaxID=2874970 RepID=A0AAV1U7N0_9STRA
MSDRGILMDFVLGSIATSGACVVSNPMEVIKTRMQLQGELVPHVTGRAVAPTVQYRNFAHALYTIGRTEGLRGIQRGLGSGISYQIFMNGPRLGLYEPLQKVFGATDATAFSFPLRNVCAAATSGMIGAFIGSPFFLVKARIQAASSCGHVNAQYAYKGMMDGFRQIIRTDGITGIYRGATASIPRVAIGSASQLATYTQLKTVLAAAGVEDGVWVHLSSSILTGLVVTMAMNPIDVVSTRIYSQKVVNGKGKLYSGVMDCFRKTLNSEGIRGFYKGWAAHYMRLGPHTIVTFIIWEKAKKVATEFGY